MKIKEENKTSEVKKERGQGEDSKTAEVDGTLENANIIAKTKAETKSNIVFALSLLSPSECDAQ